MFFLRVLLYKKLRQVKFHCVTSGRSKNFKNTAIDKQSVNCILEIVFKCPESVVAELKSHQPIITSIMQKYQPLLKFCRKITLIRSTSISIGLGAIDFREVSLKDNSHMIFQLILMLLINLTC